MSGAIEPLDATGAASLTFEPYGSRVIVFRAGGRPLPPCRFDGTADAIELRSGWSVSVGPWGPASAGPTSSSTVDLPHSWADDSRTRFFSGTASYRRSVQTPPAFRTAGSRVFLDFGDGKAVEREALPGGTMRGNSFAALIAPPIREAATVFVNGRRAGTIWAPPFRVDVTDLLRDGANDIRIDVYNTAINQLAEGGRLPDVAAVTERYGQRFRLQDVDTFAPIPSGISASRAFLAGSPANRASHLSASSIAPRSRHAGRDFSQRHHRHSSWTAVHVSLAFVASVSRNRLTLIDFRYLVLRANSSERPLGEKSGPISVPF